MSDDKFRLIGSAKVGSLEGTLRDEWDRLYAQQQHLKREQAAYEEGLDAFVAALHDSYGHLGRDRGAEPDTFRITPTGDVYAEYCECPMCQSKLFGMTVIETVEEMYKNDLISRDAIDDARKKAVLVDSKQEMRKKHMN